MTVNTPIEGPAIQTASGAYVNPLDPWSFEPDIEDIAHALSIQPRFSGHTRVAYSVAQHCVLVSRICPSGDQLAGLIHDASEYVLVDIPRPIKHHPRFAFYRQAERALQDRLYAFYGITGEPDAVRAADLTLLATEVRDLMPADPSEWAITADVQPLTETIEAWTPEYARLQFLARYRTLETARAATEAKAA